MTHKADAIDSQKLLVWLSLLLTTGFVAVSLNGYWSVEKLLRHTLGEAGWQQILPQMQSIIFTGLGLGMVVSLSVFLITRTFLRRYEMRVNDLSTVDKLTGLFNRDAYALFMDKLLAEHQRMQRPFTLLLVDIDNFKIVNERYGQALGDRLLCSVAQQLLHGLRRSDIAVRWGGEEFMLVLKECEVDEAHALAEKLRSTIENEMYEERGLRIPVTVSIGISQYQTGEAVDRTIARADAGLYFAKHSGRNRVCVSEGEATEI